MISEDIIFVLKEAFPNGAPLHVPKFVGREWACVKECIDSTWVSSAGKYVDHFEKQLSDFTGIKNVVAVVNGTAALHMALKILEIGPHDEVLVPNFTFVASANAIRYCQATPHFVDIDRRTLGVDPQKLQCWLTDIAHITAGKCFNRDTGKQIKALIVVHLNGFPADLDAIGEVCQQFNIEIIEDAAGAVGSFYKGRHVGSKGKMSIVSFNGNKIITTGGGGAILTENDALAKRVRHLTTTARIPGRAYYHDEVGYNYRMPNINAALGSAQLECLPKFLAEKRALAEYYQHAFEKVKSVNFVKEPDLTKSNFWLNAISLDPEWVFQKDEIVSSIQQKGWSVEKPWTPLDQLPMFRSCPKMDVSTSVSVQASLILLPSRPM